MTAGTAGSAGLPAGPPIDSAQAFEELAAWLPDMLEELLASPVYGDADRPPADRRGLYLFTESGRHLYVGRTGITALARAGAHTSRTSFRSRFNAHTRPGTPPGTAPFANRLMRERAHELGVPVVGGWWKRRHTDGTQLLQLFTEAKERIGAMECRVVAFEDDTRGVRSTVAETYVHAALQTPYNDFSTS